MTQQERWMEQEYKNHNTSENTINTSENTINKPKTTVQPQPNTPLHLHVLFNKTKLKRH